MDYMYLSTWEVVLGAPNRINPPCLMHNTLLFQLHVDESINCMKSFQILKDNNVAIICSHLGMSLATILVYMSQNQL